MQWGLWAEPAASGRAQWGAGENLLLCMKEAGSEGLQLSQEAVLRLQHCGRQPQEGGDAAPAVDGAGERPQQVGGGIGERGARCHRRIGGRVGRGAICQGREHLLSSHERGGAAQRAGRRQLLRDLRQTTM